MISHYKLFMEYSYKKILSILKVHAIKYNDLDISSLCELKIVDSISKDKINTNNIYFISGADLYDQKFHVLDVNNTSLKFFGTLKEHLIKDLKKIYHQDILIAYSYNGGFIFPYNFINLQHEILNQSIFLKDSLDRVDGESTKVSMLEIQDFPLLNQTSFLIKLLLSKNFDLSSTNNFVLVSSHDVDAISGIDVFKFLGRFFNCRSLYDLYIAIKFTLLDLLRPNKNHLDNIIKIIDLENRYNITSKWFLLNGKRGRYMARSSHRSMKKILEYIPKSEIGIHYNFDTFKSSSNLQSQVKLFKKNFKFNPVMGRAHYLKFSINNSFDIYSKNGIKEDYSLGYTKDLGFMSSIAGEYSMTDSRGEHILTQHPLYAMDSNISVNLQRFLITMKRISIIGGEFNFLVHHDYVFNNENINEYYQLNKILEEYSKL